MHWIIIQSSRPVGTAAVFQRVRRRLYAIEGTCNNALMSTPSSPDDGVKSASWWRAISKEQSPEHQPNKCNVATRGRFAVLVVDDTEAARYSVARTIREAGFQAVEAAGGAQALTLAPYVSAIILDLHLPDIHGLEVCRLLRAQPSTAHVPIIHITAVYVEEEQRDQSRNAGADGYLVAPVEPGALVDAVEKAINAR